jgi:predicted CoA-binding protein
MPILTTDKDIASLLRRSRTIAVVGLSGSPGRDSHRVALYLQEQGYEIIPVNPTLSEVLGAKSFPDLESIGRPVDIVDVFRRPEFVPAIAESALRSGARSLWLQFDTVDEEAAELASRGGLDVVLDRCIMVEHRRLAG